MKPRAVAIITDQLARRVLLVHRWRDGLEYYVLPGGKIEEWETPGEACIREAREETGLEITIGPQVACFNNRGRVEYYFPATNFSGILEVGFPKKSWQKFENIYKLEWIPIEQLKSLPLKPPAILPVVLMSVIYP
jgi:8-oxo-dGTP pyrophosphatase MutT (NUDIX family)